MKDFIKNYLFIFTFILLVVVLPLNKLEARATTLSESDFASKIAYLKTVYRDKEYWNNYNPCGYEGTGTLKCKCSTSCASTCDCYCGKFYLNNMYFGGQCYGFSNKMGYLIFGSVPTASWTKYNSVSNYYAGDYVRVRNDRHSIFITKVSGDTITYVDCNNYGPCQVKWERTITKSSLASITSYVYHLSGNTLTGTEISSNAPEPDNVVWIQNNSYSTPITAYPAAISGKITVYNSNLEAYSQSTRYIAYNDLCTINAIYTNGYCNVTYPTSSGTNTEYAKTSDFITNSVTPYSYTPSSNLTTYTRANLGTTFGSVFTTDKCTVVGKSGEKLQMIYPLKSGGYKLGWVSVPYVISSDFPTPLYGYNSSPTERTTVYESLSTMGTYYGQIFVDDKCTLNAVNVNEGWIYVSYPVATSTKTGYVYLDQFVPTSSKLTTFYTTTVTNQTTTYRKSDMGTEYGYVSVGDQITVVGKLGNKLQVIYPLDSGGYKIAWIYNTYVKKNLISISVTSNPTKTSYIEGQSLDKSGLVITAKYDDGSTADVTSWCTLSGYSSTVGVKTVNVSYGGKQTAFTVTVKSKSPTSIQITSNPKKINYYIGDTIDLEGLAVQAIYDNGTTTLISDYVVCVNDDTMTSGGNKTITVVYDYNDVVKSTMFNISVVEPVITLSKSSLSMEEGNTKTIIATTTPTTQMVSWKSSNTAVATVADGKITAVSSGTATISASFIYKEISYKAEVKVTVSKGPVTLESIAVDSDPEKITYEVGESLDTTGLTLKLTYSDGSKKIVSSGYTTSGFSSETAGTKTVTISYEGMNTTFVVTVNEKVEINKDIPQIVVEDQTSYMGEMVTVPIMLKNNPGIISFRLNIAYDSDVLVLENVDAADFADTSFGPVSENPLSVLWSDSLNGNNTTDGTIANLTFRVKPEAVEGKYFVSITYDEDDIFNNDWENVQFETVSGMVNVVSQEISDKWLFDDENHWKLNVSGEMIEKFAHNGGSANCHEKAICDICGKEYGDKNLSQHDGETEIRNAVAATEETAGYTGDIYCLDCGEKIEAGKVIAKLDHTHSIRKVDAIEATHTEAGNIEYYACEKCNKLFEDAMGATEITIESIVIKALGHDYGDVYKADLKKHWKECDCGSVIEATGHTEVIDAGEEATCTEKGKTEGSHCAVCKTVIVEQKEIEAAGHIEVIDAGKEATCTEKGKIEGSHCSICKTVIMQQEEIAALGHFWDEGIVTKSVSTIADGEKLYTCKTCGETRTEKISKLPSINNGQTEEPDKSDKDGTAEESDNSDKDDTTEENDKVVGYVIKNSDEGTEYKVIQVEDENTAVEFIKYDGTSRNIVIPDVIKIDGVSYTVTSIADNAFKNNKAITNVIIGDNVVYIGKNAFSGCKNVKTIIIGKNITTIGNKAFYNCTGLTKITIPSKVTKIHAYAFKNCKKLSYVTIGASVNTIGKEAFRGCSKLKKITIKSKMLKTVGKNVFKGIKSNAKIKVPSGKLKSYKKLLKNKGQSKKVIITK